MAGDTHRVRGLADGLRPVHQRRANRLRRAVRELMTRRGADLRYGRTLPRALRAAGLVDVTAAGCFPVGGVACDRLETATVRQVLQAFEDGRLKLVSPMKPVSRKPARIVGNRQPPEGPRTPESNRTVTCANSPSTTVTGTGIAVGTGASVRFSPCNS